MCGITYTSKLESMLQDINLSQDFMVQYQTDCNINSGLVRFSAMILSANSWILSTSKDFIPPKPVNQTKKSFMLYTSSLVKNRF
jgi:hypothetical protein